MFLWLGKKMVEDLRAVFLFYLFVRLVDESGGCAIAIVALVTINEDQDHFRIGMDGGTHHMPPLLSVLLSDCVRKCLIEGPQHSSVCSFIPLYDPTQWDRFSSSSILALCSLHFSLRGTPLAFPSHRVLLCWTLCREDQTTLLRSLLCPRLRSGAMALLPP
jgi:hypothetical protein